jgi:hypothetical protein
VAIKDYRDFVLVAEDVDKDSGGRVERFMVRVFDSPVGQGEKKETVSVPGGLRGQVAQLESRGLDNHVDKQIELGETLAGLLLPAYARQLFRESLLRLPDDQGLRLRLRLADELADFPWEYMYIQDTRGERTPSSFLALDPRISIVRHEALALPGDWHESPGSRRIVVAMATPEPHAAYPRLASLPAEQRSLKTALDGVSGVRVEYIPPYGDDAGDQIPGATLKDLMGVLMERTDVFHFSGHGEFSREMGPAIGSTVGEGGIVLADTANQAVIMPADRLGEVLRSKGIRLVVLGACETGRRDGYNVWSGVAASLLKAGIPAVVAMQFTIKDKLAAAFSGAFYRALVAGFTIDEAVAMGRAAMRAEALTNQPDTRDWGVPVLYLRAPGGRVFNPVSDEAARQEAEQKLGHLFEQHVRQVSSTGRLIGPVIGSMQEQTVTVDQTVNERASGLVIGSYAFSLQSGQLVVRQKADVVDGTMVGAVITRLGGGPPTVAEEEQALARLEELLGVKQVQANPPSGPRYCPQCGAALADGARFCTQCGAKVG